MQVDDLHTRDPSSRTRDELYDELIRNDTNHAFKNGKSKSTSSINEFNQFSKKTRVKTAKWKQEIFISNSITPTDKPKRRSSHNHHRQRNNSVPTISVDVLKRCNSDTSFKNGGDNNGHRNNDIDTRDETTASSESVSDEDDTIALESSMRSSNVPLASSMRASNVPLASSMHASNVPDFVKADVLKLNRSDNSKISKKNKTFETEEKMRLNENIKHMRRASSDSRKPPVRKMDLHQVSTDLDKQSSERPLFFETYEKISLNSSLKRLKPERLSVLNASRGESPKLSRVPSDPNDASRPGLLRVPKDASRPELLRVSGSKTHSDEQNVFNDKNNDTYSSSDENDIDGLENITESMHSSNISLASSMHSSNISTNNKDFSKKKIIIKKYTDDNPPSLPPILEDESTNNDQKPNRHLQERFAARFALRASHVETFPTRGSPRLLNTQGTGNTSSDNPLRMKADSGDRTILNGGSDRINDTELHLSGSDKNEECLNAIKSKNLHGEIRKTESDDKSIMSTKAVRVMGINSSALRKAQSNEIMELESPRDFKLSDDNEVHHQRFSIKNVFRNTKQSTGSTSSPTTPRSLSNSPKVSPRVINNKRQSIIIRKNSLRNSQKGGKKDRISHTQGHTFIHYFPNVIANDIQYFLIDNNRITDEDRAAFATASDFKDAMSADMCANIQIQAAVLLDDDRDLKTSICNRTKLVGSEQMPSTVTKFKDDIKNGSEIFGKEYNITFIYRVIKPFMINQYENK